MKKYVFIFLYILLSCHCFAFDFDEYHKKIDEVNKVRLKLPTLTINGSYDKYNSGVIGYNELKEINFFIAPDKGCEISVFNYGTKSESTFFTKTRMDYDTMIKLRDFLNSVYEKDKK